MMRTVLWCTVLCKSFNCATLQRLSCVAYRWDLLQSDRWISLFVATFWKDCVNKRNMYRGTYSFLSVRPTSPNLTPTPPPHRYPIHVCVCSYHLLSYRLTDHLELYQYYSKMLRQQYALHHLLSNRLPNIAHNMTKSLDSYPDHWVRIKSLWHIMISLWKSINK